MQRRNEKSSSEAAEEEEDEAEDMRSSSSRRYDCSGGHLDFHNALDVKVRKCNFDTSISIF